MNDDHDDYWSVWRCHSSSDLTYIPFRQVNFISTLALWENAISTDLPTNYWKRWYYFARYYYGPVKTSLSRACSPRQLLSHIGTHRTVESQAHITDPAHCRHGPAWGEGNDRVLWVAQWEPLMCTTGSATANEGKYRAWLSCCRVLHIDGQQSRTGLYSVA